jgi:Ca2+-binding RTX toxin-like protein
MLTSGLDQEVTYISGVNADGTIAAHSYWTAKRNVVPLDYWDHSTARKIGPVQAGQGADIKYCFDPASNWSAVEQQNLFAGLALWSAVANITLTLTSDPAQADITFSRTLDGKTATLTSTPGTASAGQIGGTELLGCKSTIQINTNSYGSGPIDGSFSRAAGGVFYTIVHELGHALGLGHGGPYNGTWDSSTQQYSAYDCRNMTIMSYVSPSETQALYYADEPVHSRWSVAFGTEKMPTTWMPLDILALQRLYGTPVNSPLSGGQTFGFNCTVSGAIAPFFDFTKNASPVITIWSTGSNNTLDLSGYSTENIVDLHAGAYSSCARMSNNIAIAYNTAVDGYVGGAGSDRITCNDNADTVSTGAGDDFIVTGAANDIFDGGFGYDRVFLSHDSSAYTITRNQDGSITVVGPDGRDTLNGIEEVDFSDGKRILATLTGSGAGDVLSGTSANDLIDASQGGIDQIAAGSGDDMILIGAGLTASDHIDGGAGVDTVRLDGDYSGGLNFAPATLTNVEYLSLEGGHRYTLTLADGLVAGGSSFNIDASQLGSADGVILDSSRLTAGSVSLVSDRGWTTFAGGTGDDRVQLHGGDGRVDGGAGFDTVLIIGEYANTSLQWNLDGSFIVYWVDDALPWSHQVQMTNVEEVDYLNATVNGTMIRGTSANDTITGTAMLDGIDISQGGVDTIAAGDSDDTIFAGAALTAADAIDGGAGVDRLYLDGDYSSGLTCGLQTISNVELIACAADHSYTLTIADSLLTTWNASCGISGYDLGVSDRLIVDASAERDGSVDLFGGAGDDILRGAVSGNINAGAGNDRLVRTFAANEQGGATLNGGGGIDVADYSGDTAGLTAVLTDEFGGTVLGTSVHDQISAVENFIGGAGNDVITGYAAANVLTGGGGNDILDGGAGADTAVYAGSRSAYVVTHANGSTTVTGPEGTDTLTGIELLQFAGRTVAIDAGTKNDFTGTGCSAILWQNDDGTAAVWTMDGFTQTGGSPVGGNPGPAWHVAGSGDFFGDGKADILWQNDDGATVVWTMDGLNQTGNAWVGANPGASWHVKGVADFNADGKDDILWQNDNGQAAIWEMNGFDVIAGSYVGGNPGTDWHIVGTGDFNKDGKADIVWQNVSGQAAIWTMDGFTQTGSYFVGGNPGPAWHLKGAGDFYGTGQSDLLWQNDEGKAVIWTMDGVSQVRSDFVGGNPGADWHIVSTGDYNADGCADILWQNDNGQAAIWTMSGITQLGGSLVGGNPGTTWHIPAGVG